MLLSIAIAIGIVAGATILWSYFQTPSIEIHNPRFVITPKAIAIYMMIHNHGFGADCLVGVDIVKPFTAKTEIHKTEIEGGVARMHPVDMICVAGRSEVELGPGGYHIMVMGNFSSNIKELAAVLHFQRSGDINIIVPIEASQRETHSH
jgi:copper(I)-binding protein